MNDHYGCTMSEIMDTAAIITTMRDVQHLLAELVKTLQIKRDQTTCEQAGPFAADWT